MTPVTVTITASGQIVGAGPFPLVGIPAFFSSASGQLMQSTPQIVPVQPVVSQVFSVALNQQPCTIKLTFKQIQVPQEIAITTEPPVYETINPGFLDLYVNGSLIIGGVICQTNNLIVRDAYLGFTGDLAFVDTQPDAILGPHDPLPAGLGSRWLLTYWSDLV